MERSPDNKKQDKNSFILYLEQAEIVDELSDDDAGKLFKAILFYVHTGEEPSLSKMLKLAFIPIRQSLHRDLEKWRNVKIGKAEAGKLGGLAKQANARNAKIVLEKKPSKNKQNLANLPVYVSECVSVSVPVPESVNENEYITTVDMDKIITSWRKARKDDFAINGEFKVGRVAAQRDRLEGKTLKELKSYFDTISLSLSDDLVVSTLMTAQAFTYTPQIEVDDNDPDYLRAKNKGINLESLTKGMAI